MSVLASTVVDLARIQFATTSIYHFLFVPLKQRIVLARALLTEAPVLVLDEPTAHLDSPTARALVEDVFAAAGARGSADLAPARRHRPGRRADSPPRQVIDGRRST